MTGLFLRLALVQVIAPIGAITFFLKLIVNRQKIIAPIGAIKLRFGQISSCWPCHKTTMILVHILLKDDDAGSILAQDG